MDTKPDEWKFFDALAAEAGVHHKTLIRWARHGLRGARLKPRRLGVRYQTTKAHLDEFFAAGTQAVVPAGLPIAPAPTIPLARQRRADKAAREALGMG